MKSSGSSWLKFGLFTVGLGQSFVFVIVPPLARELGLTEVQVSLVFAFSAVAWALTSASWGRASDKYGRRNIASSWAGWLFIVFNCNDHTLVFSRTQSS